MPDPRTDGAFSTVATAPSPATSGTSLTLQTGDGARFPSGTFYLILCPASTRPIFVAGSGAVNAEIAQATRTAGSDTLTLTRAQLGTTARTVVVGDEVRAGPLAHLIDDLLELPSYAQGLNIRNAFAPLQGIQNYKSSNTRHADQGITNASRGAASITSVQSNQVGYTREVAIGDSVTAGCTGGQTGNVTFSRTDSWCYAMRDTLSIWGIPANGTGIYKCQDNAFTNTQYWTVSGTWAGASNVTFVSSTSVGASMTLTVDRPGSIVDVFYADGFSGTFSISVNGAASGAGFASVTGAGTNRTGKKRLVVNTYPGSTIKITVTTAGTGVGVIGASVWAPNGGLVMDNIAQSGSKVQALTDRTGWTDTSNVGALWNVFGGTYKGGISGKSRQVTDAVTTAASTTVTSATAAFDADRDTGEPIDCVPDATKGIALPAGTYIVSVTNSTTVVVSNPANVSATAQTVNITRDPSAVHVVLGGNDLQNARTGAQIKTDMTTLYNNIKTNWPNCDVIFHLENELAPANASSAQELDMQQNMYQLADSVDAPLYDWRDRAGSYATGMANGIYSDPVAHMTPSMYVNLGAALAFARCVAGAGPQQAVRGPVLDNDVVPKWYADGFGRFKTPIVANGTAFTATEQVQYQIPIPPNTLKVGDTIKIDVVGTYTATVVGAIIGRLRMGTAGTTSDTQLVTTVATANAGATGAAYHIEACITVRTIGASGTVEATVWACLDNTATRIGAPTSTTIDTTAQQFLSLTGLASGGTAPSGTPNIAYHLTAAKT